ncbi:chromate resistance protein ChrB domain-containing protein [Dongia sp.]|uniref:chromate resistance protein ChrB domain-containing protein n=1 Tax=Dongia sp. TaxID=1977262 RepID=UPI0035B2FF3F
MPNLDSIQPQQLSRLIGLADAPVILDVRNDEDFAADPRFIPGAKRRDYTKVADWAQDFAGQTVIVSCQRGLKLSQGVAAWLRHEGIAAESLEGGHEAWVAQGGLLVNDGALPKRDAQGRTLWVTRARPKIDRIACPWLIRRFVDPDAIFLFVAQSEVMNVADRFGATPFDIEGAFWSHRGDTCTFDTMLAEFGLNSDALERLAQIVRGADTDRLDIAPQAAGLLAASLGFSRMYKDDVAQLTASLPLYDAFYRWCRDAVGEAHNWVGHQARSGR